MTSYNSSFSKTTDDTIEASDFSTEFDALEGVFDENSGHAHDGTSSEGPVIGLIGDAGVVSPLNKVVVDTTNDRIGFFVDVSSSSVEQLRVEDGVIVPVTDSDVDLGTTSIRFKDGYIDTLTITTSATVAGNSILDAGDIGVSVQAYDANTAKTDVSNTFTATQAISVTGDHALHVVTSDSTHSTYLIHHNNSVRRFALITNPTNNKTSLIKYDSGVTPQAQIELTDTGDVDVVTGTLKVGGVEVPTLSSASTLTNKTLTSPVINTSVSGTAFLDEDDMASNSATKFCSQQSIKAYVDAQVGGLPSVTYETLDANGDVGTSAGQLAIGNHNHSGVYEPVDSTIVRTNTSQTLTNKTLTSPVINTSVSGTAILDEDNMSSNSATKLATQQSIKAYVDNTRPGTRGALVRDSNGQTISDSTMTVINWDNEEYDTDSIHSTVTNNTRLTVPSGVSRVRVAALITWVQNSTGSRNVSLWKNGTVFVGGGARQIGANSSAATIMEASSAVVEVTPGDYFEVAVYQTSGSSLGISSGGTNSWFAMEIIE